MKFLKNLVLLGLLAALPVFAQTNSGPFRIGNTSVIFSAAICFEATPGAGVDTCLLRSSAGILSVTGIDLLTAANWSNINIAPAAQPAAASPAVGINPLTVTGGVGGAQSATTGNGAAGGATSVISGVGGLAGSSSGTAGAGGATTLQGGAGGAGPVTGGAGGAVAVTGGVGGNGSTTGGAGGGVTITAGNAGTGGTPAGGVITLVPGVPTSTGATGKVLIAGATAGSHLASTQTTAPAPTGTCTTPGVAAGATDMRGTATTASCTADQTIILTFNKPYASAPVCVVAPANAAAAATASAGAVTSAAASTTALTINTPHVSTTSGQWNYVCIE